MAINTTQLNDGLYRHECDKCKASRVNKYLRYMFPCRCKTNEVLRPAPSFKPGPAAFSFKPVIVPCAYLGEEVGEPIKVSCGGQWRRLRACHCPERPQLVSPRTGAPRQNLAANNWWCTDLGNIRPPKPSVYQACSTCPFRTPQLMLPAPDPRVEN